jgi:hypothetical protein
MTQVVSNCARRAERATWRGASFAGDCGEEVDPGPPEDESLLSGDHGEDVDPLLAPGDVLGTERKRVALAWRGIRPKPDTIPTTEHGIQAKEH